MNLADELMGIRPNVNLSPGRLVSHDDPPEAPKIKPKFPAMQRVKDFIDKAEGEFSAQDITLETGIKRKVASEYLSRYARQGLIKKTGYICVWKKTARLNLWRRVWAAPEND